MMVLESHISNFSLFSNQQYTLSPKWPTRAAPIVLPVPLSCWLIFRARKTGVELSRDGMPSYNTMHHISVTNNLHKVSFKLWKNWSNSSTSLAIRRLSTSLYWSLISATVVTVDTAGFIPNMILSGGTNLIGENSNFPLSNLKKKQYKNKQINKRTWPHTPLGMFFTTIKKIK